MPEGPLQLRALARSGENQSAGCCTHISHAHCVMRMKNLPVCIPSLTAASSVLTSTPVTRAIARQPPPPVLRPFSLSAMRGDPFKPAKRVAGQRQDVWYAAPCNAASHGRVLT